MASLNETPGSNRLHIGVFGRTNSGKSSFINSFTGQEVSIASAVAGTTTDLVYKAMEIHPLGPCVLMDTAGFDDSSELGNKRVEKTGLAVDKSDIAIIVIPFDSTTAGLGEEDFPVLFPEENDWYQRVKKQKLPVLFLLNKSELDFPKAAGLAEYIRRQTGEVCCCISCKEGLGMDLVKEALVRLMPEDFGAQSITGELVEKDDLVMLVMPQDIQAPKGRLILPQVQTLRELLDRKCLVMSVTTDQFELALSRLSQPPKLIITDSQVFGYVYDHKPKESMLTSFSVLFAAYKGDLPYYMEGAKAIDGLTEQSRVLIAECCTHAPLSEDIGREKIPRMLRKRVGEQLKIDMVSGTDFPEDPSGYDLIIQCGACMFNRKYVLARIDRAKGKQVPMTNYGVTIAHLCGILDKISLS